MRPAAVLVLIAGAGCQFDVQLLGGDPDALPGLVSIEIAPAETSIEVPDLTAPPEIVDLVATGRFEDGREEDVTSRVVWSVDRAAPGSFVAPGRYRPSHEAGGRVEVTASSGVIAGSATLTVHVTHTIIDPAFPPPEGASEAFETGTFDDDPMREPAIVYPAHETKLPPNLAPILFQMDPGDGNDATRLRFTCAYLSLDVLTGADRWQPDDASWFLVARSCAGETIDLEIVAAPVTSPPVTGVELYAGAPIAIAIAARDAGGVVRFRSNGANAIVSATLDQSTPSRFYPIAPDETCASCHAVSPDGARMALGYGGETLQVVDLPDLGVRVPASEDIDLGWSAFSPDGTLLLVAHRGTLTLLDAATGEPVGDGAVSLPPDALATHPDWSPDGTRVAVALGTTVGNRDMKGGRIAVLPYEAGGFGEPAVLVGSTGDNDNNFFPRWSPDGAHIVYVHAASPSRGAKTAELRIVAAEGGTPIPLRIASHRVGLEDDVPELGTSMPSFAPGSTDGEAWLVFTSRRPYGLIRPMSGQPAIWIAALDLGRAADGDDPSAAAFWLPAQDASSMSYVPVWSVEPDALP